MQDAKAKLESGQLDFNALDEYVNFKDSNKSLDGLIGQIKGTPGTAGDYAAQATRGLLGFGKDIVMGIGELAYEGVKAVPKLGRMAYTSNGQALAQIDSQILAENIRLGNITPGTVGQGALDVGAAIVKPITDPWKRGDYVESVTRAAAELATLPIAWTKAQRAAQAAKAKAALEAAEAAKAKAALDAAEAAKAKAKAALEAEEAAKVGDGVHVSGTPVGRGAIYENPSSAVQTRVDDLQSQIPENAQGRITMGVAVVEDANGTRSVLVSTSEPRGYLRPGVTLQPGETVIAGIGHAEADIVSYASTNGLKIIDIGATRPVCGHCQDVIVPTGANITTPLKIPTKTKP